MLKHLLLISLFHSLPLYTMNSMEITTYFITLENSTVWYKTCCTQFSKNKIPLICVHGGPGSNHEYLRTLEHLATTLPIIFYDQSGCGNSRRADAPDTWNFDFHVQELKNFIEALGYEKVYLLGHSYGGSLALQYASQQEKKVCGLILASPFFSAAEWITDNKKYLEELPEKIRNTIIRYEQNGDTENADYQSALQFFYKKHLCRIDPWPQCFIESFNKFNDEMYKTMWSKTEFSLTGNLRSLDLSDSLTKLHMPTLVTCGLFDGASPQTMEKLIKKIPNAKLITFTDSSHNPHLEETNTYIETIKKFIAETEQS